MKIHKLILAMLLLLLTGALILNLLLPESIISFADGDEQRMMLMGLRRFTKYTNMPNIVGLRELITNKLVRENEYCF